MVFTWGIILECGKWFLSRLNRLYSIRKSIVQVRRNNGQLGYNSVASCYFLFDFKNIAKEKFVSGYTVIFTKYCVKSTFWNSYWWNKRLWFIYLYLCIINFKADRSSKMLVFQIDKKKNTDFQKWIQAMQICNKLHNICTPMRTEFTMLHWGVNFNTETINKFEICCLCWLFAWSVVQWNLFYLTRQKAYQTFFIINNILPRSLTCKQTSK